MGLLAVSGTVLYQPLQSNLKWHVKHRMQPFTFVSSCDSPQFGHTVASLDFAGRVGSAEQSASLQIMAVEFTIRIYALWPSESASTPAGCPALNGTSGRGIPRLW